MTIKYFQPKPTTYESLKSMYRKLAFLHHPDCGGSQEAMKAVNNEYDYLFPILKNVHVNKDNEQYTKETTEPASAWKDIIHNLIALQMRDVLVEQCGSFLWISGLTWLYKEALKAMGFKWSSNKRAWYLAPQDYKKRNRKTYNMEDIRDMYGSKAVDTSDGEKERGKKAITA